MVGALGVHFSAMGMVAPIAGALFGSFPSGLLLIILFLVRNIVVVGTGVTVGVPTLFAMLSWSFYQAKEDRFLRVVDVILHVVLPLISIATFMVFVRGLASFYALYWLVPVACLIARLAGNQSVFLQALSSTFVAHMVGSMMWLFLVPMNAQQWIALIPIVAMERLAYAVGMSSVYAGMTKVNQLFVSWVANCWVKE